MNESMRTLIFVAIAAVSLIAARATTPSVSVSPKVFSQVGSEFYPQFTDASAAKSLQVINYNPDTATVRVFGVEQGPDNVWRIPSRNNYPVDGKDRLAKTATSILGIKREALAGQRKSQHAEFGVIDPMSESVSDFKGVGNRLILKDGKDGNTLVDLIIGKERKSQQPGYFYVRNPKEDQTYVAKIGLDLSTKFSDWIEPDLLKLDGSKLRSIVIDKHSIEITNEGGRLTGKETNKLTRSSATDKWNLDELDAATEEVNEDEVRKLVQALDDLKIVGVRPKGEQLKKRLESDKGLVLDQRTRIELQDMGFFFVPTQGKSGVVMVSQEGDVFASTDQGVVYELHFGSVFTGSEDEVEAGFIKKTDEATPAEKSDAEKSAADSEEKPGNKKIKSRFLFVQAAFNSEMIGPKPEAPTKPEAPAEEAAAETPKSGDAADATATENGADQKPDPKKGYEAAMATYEADQKKHEADLSAYEEKVKAGQKQVKDLNRRFAEWYYVISGDSFENLRQGRKTLVKPKAEEKPAEEAKPPQ